MSGATVQSGSGGKVLAHNADEGTWYLIARISQWNASISVQEAAWGDSDSGGKTNRVAGREDITGTITGKPDKEHPQYNDLLWDDTSEPNNKNIVAMILWEDGNETTPEDFFYLPRALISVFNIGIDNDTKLPVDFSATFGADGTWFKPRETGVGQLTGTAARAALTAGNLRDIDPVL